jgi:O-antigen/teichoic acid export membrane protein
VWLQGWGITGALLGWAMAYVVVAFYALVYIKRDVPFSWRPTYEAMPDVFRYGNTAYLGQLIDQTEGHAILLLLALFVSPSEVGMFSIAIVFSKFVLWPSTAIRRPMLPKLASMDPARTASAFIQVVQVGLFLSFTFAAAVTLVSPYAIPLLYGKSFEGVVPLILILVPGILAHAVVMIINGYFMSIGSPKRRVYINVFRVVSLLTAVVVGGFFGGIRYATLSMSACFVLTMIVAVFLACWRNTHVKFRDLVVLNPAVSTYFRKMSFKVKHLLQ